jgi:hypothetical protein
MCHAPGEGGSNEPAITGSYTGRFGCRGWWPGIGADRLHRDSRVGAYDHVYAVLAGHGVHGVDLCFRVGNREFQLRRRDYRVFDGFQFFRCSASYNRNPGM